MTPVFSPHWPLAEFSLQTLPLPSSVTQPPDHVRSGSVLFLSYWVMFDQRLCTCFAGWFDLDETVADLSDETNRLHQVLLHDVIEVHSLQRLRRAGGGWGWGWG